MASSSTSERNGKGRKKMNMVKIENKNNLQVTFSKRKNGLFKKASEFCTLTGSEVGILVCSPGGKVYSFGNPSVKKIMNKCFDEEGGINHDTLMRHDERLVEAHRNNKVKELNGDLTMEELKIEEQKRRAASIREREKVELHWKTPTEKMTETQLYEMDASLIALQDVVTRMKMFADERMNMGVNPMGVPFPIPGVENPRMNQLGVLEPISNLGNTSMNPMSVKFPFPNIENPSMNPTVVSEPIPDMREVGMKL